MAEVGPMPNAMPETVVPPIEGQQPQTEEQQQPRVDGQVVDLTKPILTLSRNIKVRVMQHSDAEAFSKHGNNHKIARNMRARWPDPYTADKSHDFIAMIRNQDKWAAVDRGRPSNALKSDENQADKNDATNIEAQKVPNGWTITMGDGDQVIGSIGFEPDTDIHVRSISFGYWIGEEFWGQGLATEIVTAFVRWLWDTFPYIVRLSASVYSWNPASARILEKAGFSLEGRLRASVWRYDQLCDLLIYGAVRDGTLTTEVPPASNGF